MFLDARNVESNTQLSTDLCIVGGGGAGIALATEVSQAGFSTILLEAGGTEYDEKTQEV
jgi:choline dehydrogenase-like flavoprotein